MRKYFIHILLFLLTIITTTIAGTEWIYGRSVLDAEWINWQKLLKGLSFSIPFLAFLTVHEFGHFFTAKWYKVKVTLPFYIPFWLGIISSIGTMGAFIQIKSKLISRKEFFDIGIAGPLAGFVIAFAVLIYGYTTLPSREYVFEIHPEYKTYFPKGYQKFGLEYEKYAYDYYPNTPEFQRIGLAGKKQEGNLGIGKNLMMVILENYWVKDKSRIPHPYEMMHYPFLMAGFLGLLFTALNLIPIGQLDGGHILYGLVGAKIHNLIAPILLTIFVTYAGLGIINPYISLDGLMIGIPLYVLFLYLIFSRTFENPQNVLLLALSVFSFQFVLTWYFPTLIGYGGWLVFCLIIGRFLGVYHPKAEFDNPLDWKRKFLGVLALIIFILCFTPTPFIIN
jgi:membrane-associated protease RseP (regulator of RpoE activity)